MRPEPVAHQRVQWLILWSIAVPLTLSVDAAQAIGRFGRGLRESWSKRASLRLFAALVFLAAIPAGAAVHHVYFDDRELPDFQALLHFEPPTTGRVYDAKGRVLLEVATEYRQVVTYREIPPVVRDAVLAAEDKNFFAHRGVDYTALPRVAFKAARVTTAELHSPPGARAEGWLRLPQGGSTLTQQLVRSYFLRHLTAREGGNELLFPGLVPRMLARCVGVPTTNKLLRKVEEIRTALWLEREMERRFGSRRAAKEEIFARYVSFIYLGHGRYGFSAASDYYFGKPLSSYRAEDADKAATLAGIAKWPRAYAPTPSWLERPKKRRDLVLGLMEARGYLSRDLARRLERAPLVVAPPRPVETDAPAVVEHALRELRRDGRYNMESLAAGRISVHATVDRGIQEAANDALEEGLRRYEQRHPGQDGLVQGAVVVLRNRDAAILALCGGRRHYQGVDASYSDLNRAVEARRQPGSTMKPLLYLTAFRQGSVLDQPVLDAPISLPTGMGANRKWISNYDGVFKGVIPLREAFAQSRNAPAVWLAQQVGVTPVLDTARDLGLASPLRPSIATILGASEVSLLKLANVYRAIASGLRADPYVVARIVDSEGGVRYEPTPFVEPLRVEPQALEQAQEGLRGVVRLPRGTAHALDGAVVPVMGKTGTTNDFRDALFVGSTYGPEGLTVGVWIGFDDNRSLGPAETGARSALPVFAELLRRVFERDHLAVAAPFPEPIEEGITRYLSLNRPPEAVPLAAAGLAPAIASLAGRPVTPNGGESH
jgi:membrane peptidoglycan carboxypeptidase